MSEVESLRACANEDSMFYGSICLNICGNALNMREANNEFKILVKSFVFKTFSGLNTKNLKTISNIILVIMESKSISISDIGRSIAEVFDIIDQSRTN